MALKKPTIIGGAPPTFGEEIAAKIGAKCLRQGLLTMSLIVSHLVVYLANTGTRWEKHGSNTGTRQEKHGQTCKETCKKSREGACKPANSGAEYKTLVFCHGEVVWVELDQERTWNQLGMDLEPTRKETCKGTCKMRRGRW